MPAFRRLLTAVVFVSLAQIVAIHSLDAQPTDSLPAPPRVAEATPGYFGVLAGDAPDDSGALLRDVIPGSPAAAAKLQPGDVIAQVADMPIANARGLIAALQAYVAGDRVPLVVIQAGFRTTIEVTLGERPVPAQRRYADFGRVTPTAPTGRTLPARQFDTLLEDRTPSDERLGLRTVAATQAALERRGLPDRPGALVVRVERDSPADLAGIPMSALITNANGTAVTSPQSLAAALADALGDVELTYCIGREERSCRVEVD